MKRHTIEFISSEFTKYGFTLLTKEYKNSSQKLDYICSNGHKHRIRWDHFNAGHGCPYCTNRPPIDIEFVRFEFKKEGYILLTTEYINNQQKLNYICSEGHRHSITWGNWSQGNRCPHCSGKAKRTIEFIREQFKKAGYALLNNVYKNCGSSLNYICPKGHRHSISWDHWKQGRRCSTCAIINNSGSNHYNWKGGISCEPYCDIWLDKEFKELIKERDNYQCQNPDCWGTNHKLCIHHIDYNKKNCSPENLITVCNSCNIRANYDRYYWQKTYNEIMEKK